MMNGPFFGHYQYTPYVKEIAVAWCIINFGFLIAAWCFIEEKKGEIYGAIAGAMLFSLILYVCLIGFWFPCEINAPAEVIYPLNYELPTR